MSEEFDFLRHQLNNLQKQIDALAIVVETLLPYNPNTQKQVSESTEPDALLCPDCGGAMALRTNKSNGNKFWGCKKFPECRGTRDENGLSKAEREEQRYKREAPQEAGFSFNKAKRNPVTEVSPPLPPIAETVKNFNPFRK